MKEDPARKYARLYSDNAEPAQRCRGVPLCIARDGEVALTVDGKCAGCGKSIFGLYDSLNEEQRNGE